MLKVIEKFPDYMVSDDGRVWSIRKEIWLKQNCSSNSGYPMVGLYKDGKRTQVCIHRLVAEMFIPNPYNYSEVNHKDENKTNNNASNLEWCTRSYNNIYNGRAMRVGATKAKRVQQIKNGIVIAEYKSTSEAERATGIHDISKIASGKGYSAGGYHWRYVEDADWVEPDWRITHQKAVQQIKNGKIIGEYESASEASRITGIDNATISFAAKGKRKSAGGYHWKYVFDIDWIEPECCRRRSKPVRQIKDGVVICEYKSIKEASRMTGICDECISAVANGKKRMANGYVWKFIDVESEK